VIGGMVIRNGMEWKAQEAVVTLFEALSWHLLEGTEKSHDRLQIIPSSFHFHSIFIKPNI
jgi:hypothetical protein